MFKPGDIHKRCVHFYACLCAFASDEKLAEEFEYYINLDANTDGMPEGKICFNLIKTLGNNISGVLSSFTSCLMNFELYKDKPRSNSIF